MCRSGGARALSDITARPGHYERLAHGERQQYERPFVEGLSALRRFLPLSRQRFDRLLGEAIGEVARRGTGFYLGGFAARRALAGELILDVDPAMLKKRLDHRFRQDGQVYNIREMFLGAGDWRPLVRLLQRSSTHQEVLQIVAAGFEYRKTDAYRRALEQSETDNPVKRNFVSLSSRAKVEAYFRQTAEMCRSVHEVGMLRRGVRGRRLAGFANPSVRLPWIEFGEGDIGVAIGRAGQLFRFASGKHRTAAAQALELKSIPVEVRLVHADWLVRRMDESGLPPIEALLDGVRALQRVLR